GGRQGRGGAVNGGAPGLGAREGFGWVPRGLCTARHTTAYSHPPASNALTACCTAPPMFVVPTWMCQLRFGGFSIAIMQLTETIEMPSTSACPVAGSSGYVASPSMSDICNPESATASLTAVSAWAASGSSAERLTLAKPTPLTAILQRFSHMFPSLTPAAVPRGGTAAG